MSKYLQFGVSEDFEGYKNQSITTSNLIFLIELLMGIAAVLLAHSFIADLVFLAYIFVAGIAISLLLNILNMPDIGRFGFVLTNALVISLLNAYPIAPGEPFYSHLYLAQLSIIVLPWIIIDLREGSFVFIASAIALLFFVFQPYIVESFTMEVSNDFLASQFMRYAIYAFALVNVIISIYVLSLRNARNELKGKKMIDEIKGKSKEAEKRQADLQLKIEDINQSHKTEENRNWVSKNLTQISDVIRNSKSENMFPDLAEAMVECLDANQAAIYILNDDDDDPRWLELKGCYAIDRRKYTQQKLPVNEGLPGQSFKDKEFIYINNLPPVHLRYTSGLGEEPPGNLAVIPLIENENISGVMEVASHHEFQEKEKLFFKQVSESIASFVISNSVNIKIKHLIEQNQMQAEEMKAQEEEMTQNMEELQATQEEMSRKEKEYLDQIAQLEEELESKG